MRTLYPEITPFHTFFLETGTSHKVYVEESGNPNGIPAIFLHGGPCSGTKPDHRRFFDPQKYHIVLFDQRGSGLSQPFGEVDGNTTQDLIDDMERIRQQLRIDTWLLFGGSWGGALALLYAQQHPNRVAAMIIRGIFLARRMDLEWFMRAGAGRIYPEQWQRFAGIVPEAQRGNLIEGIHAMLWARDELGARRAAKEWTAWNGLVALGLEYSDEPHDEHATLKLVRQVRMEVHYAYNRYFIEENQILMNCERLRHIPTIIVHGRNDLVCPAEAGYSLYQAMPHAEFKVLAHSGHVARGEEMLDALVEATDRTAERLHGR
ncbi:MAG: prolyl aminopeptidase [Gammaproteobacteria bacterium]